MLLGISLLAVMCCERVHASSIEVKKCGGFGASSERYQLAYSELELPGGSPQRASKALYFKEKGSFSELLKYMQSKKSTQNGALVFYRAGQPKSKHTRRVLSNKLVLVLSDSAHLEDVERLQSVLDVKPLSYLDNGYLVRFSSSEAAYEGVADLSKFGHVEPQFIRGRQKREALNDPYLSYDPNQSGYQWHLHNTGENGGTEAWDLNVIELWDQYRGGGVKIGVVDDGLDVAHPDLRVDTSIDHDWRDASPNDPTPSEGEDHGTSVAGVAAAIGGNGVGVSGVAPEAELVGLRLIGSGVTDAEEAEAMLWENQKISIYTNSWGPSDLVTYYEPAGMLVRAALVDGVSNGRSGRGSIYVWSGGNGLVVDLFDDEAFYGQTTDNSNYDGYANLRETIAVGAVSDGARLASEVGANIVCVGLSANGSDSQAVTTTQTVNSGSYRHDFSGTSASAPQVAGVCALMLEANPLLGWRDVQEVLIKSSQRVQAGYGDWMWNGGGYAFHQSYGAGLLDAAAAVSTAEAWVNLGELHTQVLEKVGLNQELQDNSINGLTLNFDFREFDGIRVEHVELSVDIDHSAVGDLEITLISPSGMRSELAVSHIDATDNLAWTFMSVRHWGESSVGQWKVEVRDLLAGDVGVVNGVKLEVFGAEMPVAQGPHFVGLGQKLANVGKPFFYQLKNVDYVQSYSVTGLPAGLSLDGDGLISGIPSHPGEYQVQLGCVGVTGSSSEDLTIVVAGQSNISLAEALDFEQLVVKNLSDAAWGVDVGGGADGGDAVVVSGLGDNAEARLAIPVSGPGVLAFDWKVSSEQDYDYLELSIDGELIERVTGELDWQSRSVEISDGEHMVSWVYRHDLSGVDGSDSAWIDHVSYVQKGSFLEWQQAHFTTAELQQLSFSGVDADADADGRRNLVEFLLDSDPLSIESIPALLMNEHQSELSLSYQVKEGRTAVLHRLEVSSDLNSWTELGLQKELGDASFEIWRAVEPLTQSTRFYRLKLHSAY